MSLINDALKKTQRMRAGPEENTPTMGGYAGPRGRSNSGPSLSLLVIGGLILVLGAIGGTVLLLKSKSSSPVVAAAVSVPVVAAPVTALTSAPAPAPVVAATVAVPTVDLSAPPPVIVAPVLTVAKLDPTPAPAAASPAPATDTAATPASSPSAATAANPAAKAKVDVSTFIDAIHVTGVRFSEGSSKVLMNDHVYKLNDIVERVLNIRLIEINNDSLTFVDENGAVYKKNF